MNTALVAGRTMTLLPPPFTRRGGARGRRNANRVTHFAGGPHDVRGDAQRTHRGPADLSSWRSCVSGGASHAVEVLRGFEEKYGVMILEGYGLSETSPVASFNLPDVPRKTRHDRRPGPRCEMDLRSADGSAVAPGRSARSSSRARTS